MKAGKMKSHYDDLRLMFERGLTYKAIAEILDCDLSTVKFHLSVLGLKRRSYNINRVTENPEFTRLYNDGLTYAEISEKLNISEWAVFKTAKRLGLPTRKKEEKEREYTQESRSDYSKILSMKW